MKKLKKSKKEYYEKKLEDLLTDRINIDNVSNWDTANMTNIAEMFKSSKSCKSICWPSKYD